MDGFLESELQQLEDRFLSRVKIFNQLSQTEKINLAIETDFFAELERLGLTRVLQKLQSEYAGIVGEITKLKPGGIEPIQYVELQTLMDLDTESLLNTARSYSSQFKSSLLKGLVSGESTSDIVSRLGDIGLKTNQTIAAVTTAKDEFNAASMAKVFEDSPDTRFKLAGPLDDRTRCQCKAVMLDQPKNGFTKAEIDEGAWTKIALSLCPKFDGKYTFINRGGYNCRHFIQIAGLD